MELEQPQPSKEPLDILTQKPRGNLPLVSREWREGSNSSYKELVFFFLLWPRRVFLDPM